MKTDLITAKFHEEHNHKLLEEGPWMYRNIRIRREAEESGSRSEEELLETVLGDLQSRDPDAFVHVDVRNNRICVLTLITSPMKQNFSDNPTVLHYSWGGLGP